MNEQLVGTWGGSSSPCSAGWGSCTHRVLSPEPSPHRLGTPRASRASTRSCTWQHHPRAAPRRCPRSQRESCRWAESSTRTTWPQVSARTPKLTLLGSPCGATGTPRSPPPPALALGGGDVSAGLSSCSLAGCPGGLLLVPVRLRDQEEAALLHSLLDLGLCEHNWCYTHTHNLSPWQGTRGPSEKCPRRSSTSPPSPRATAPPGRGSSATRTRLWAGRTSCPSDPPTGSSSASTGKAARAAGATIRPCSPPGAARGGGAAGAAPSSPNFPGYPSSCWKRGGTGLIPLQGAQRSPDPFQMGSGGAALGQS